ncbi:MAG: hypothetical protein ACYS30_23405, partial [Planctomycetota bacterium]
MSQEQMRTEGQRLMQESMQRGQQQKQQRTDILSRLGGGAQLTPEEISTIGSGVGFTADVAGTQRQRQFQGAIDKLRSGQQLTPEEMQIVGVPQGGQPGGGAQPAPLAGFDERNVPASAMTDPMRRAMHDARFLPQAHQYAEQLPGSQQYFDPNVPGAQQQMQNLFGGQGTFQGPQSNPFFGFGADVLGQGYGMMLGQRALPPPPNIQGAPTQYNAPQAPGFNQFDPNAVQGPNVQQVQARQPGAQDFTG